MYSGLSELERGGGSLHCPTQYFADHLILSQPERGAEYARVIITAPPPAFFSDFPTVLHARYMDGAI